MARIARVVAPGAPHHVIQRGNRRQTTFFLPEDYAFYISLMSEWTRKHGVEVWAYCLMPNHVHLIAVPQAEDGLRLAIGEAHRRYTRHVNAREGWTGHLWQGRFASFPMDERHLLAAARYVENNPVRAGLAGRASEYPYSSASAHVSGRDDTLVAVAPLLGLVPDWNSYLGGEEDEAFAASMKASERTGRPLGDAHFLQKIESLVGRSLERRKPGPKTGS